MPDRGRGAGHPGGPPPPEPGELSSACEALLFACGQPLSARELAGVLGVSEEEVRRALEQLDRLLQESQRGIQLAEVAGGFMLVTRARFFPYLRRLAPSSRPAPLSAAALETLAVIAYRQPLTRAEIEAIRGVNCESALSTLLERGLIEVAGHRQAPGRPALYRTTRKFLETFGLRSLEDLPPVAAAGDGAAPARSD